MKSFSTFSYRPRLASTRDWTIILVCFMIGLAATLLWHLSLFDKVVNGEVLGTQQHTASTTIHTSDFSSVETIFQDRAAEELKYQNGEYQFIDPSK